MCTPNENQIKGTQTHVSQADLAEAARARGAEASSSSAREASLREEIAGLKQAGRQHMEEAERLGLRVDQIAEFNRQLKVSFCSF